MKKVLLTMLIVILGLPLLAQEISFPSAIVSAGGGTGDGNPVNLSRWRIGQVHVLTIPIDQSTRENDLDWNVTVYPNPVKDFLHLEFELPETRELFLKITDVAGRVFFIQEPRPFEIGSNAELNMSKYPPALYLLQISSPDLKAQKIFRVQKI